MSWLEKLNDLKKQSGKTTDDIAALSGIPKGTLNKLFAGQTKDPQLSTIKSVVHCLGRTLDDLDDNREIDKNEQALLKKYRLLTPAGKKAINNTIDTMLEYEKSFQQATVTNNISYIPRHLPFYDMPVSAGTGVFLDSDHYEVIEVGPNVPIQTNFLLRASGDSMEPLLHDGDTLYIKQQPSVEDGEIGIFYLDGNAYVKKMQHNGNKCFLISLNSNYAPIEVKSDEFKCYGKVLN